MPKDYRPTETATTPHITPGSIMALRIIYYIGGAVLALLAIRFVFALFGAADGNAVISFIYTVSGVLVSPFYGVFGEPMQGESQFAMSTLVAMAVYGLITVATAKLFIVGGSRRPGA